MAVPAAIDLDRNTVLRFSRELRTVLQGLHDDPLDESLAMTVVQLLVHDAPQARAAYRHLEDSGSRCTKLRADAPHSFVQLA